MISISVPAFRALVVSSYVASLILVVLDGFLPLPPPIDAAYETWLIESLDTSASILVLGAAGLVLLVATLAAGVGLLLLKHWGRVLAVVCTLASLPLFALFGVVVQSGWAALFEYLSAMLWGATLAVAYLSPIAQHFEPAAADGR